MKHLIIFIFLIYSLILNGQVVVNFSTPGFQTWTCPVNVTQITVECWGAGGGAGNSANTSSNGGSGGGGGAFASKTINVTPGNLYYLTVGNSGTGALANSTALAQNGGDSWFNFVNSIPTNDSYILAKGGTRGNNNSLINPNNGGASSACFGGLKVSGNSGSSGTTNGGGNGGNAANNGGNGGIGSTTTNGLNGSPPGGGGGGANDSPSHKGGNGAVGLVKISYFINCSGSPLVPVISNSSLLGCGNISLWANGYANIPGLQFQWQSAPTSSGPWSDITNATDTLLNYTCNSDTYFKLKVTCIFSSILVQSNSVFYDYFETPLITTQPINASYCQNTTQIIPLSVNATILNNGSLNYQWYSNSINSPSGGTIIPGATFSSYTPNVTSIGQLYYYCLVNNTGSSCYDTTNTSLINVVSSPIITLQPIPVQNICLGASVNLLSVSYTGGNGTPTYQWFSNSINAYTGGSLIVGANSASYLPPTPTIIGTTYYYCIINFSIGGCNQITSNIASITVSAPTVAGVLTSNQTICQSSIPALMSVSGSIGNGFIWQYSLNNSLWNNISNSSNDTLFPGQMTLAGINFTQNYYFRVSVIGNSGCNSQTTNSILITVIPPPVAGLITTPSTDQYVCFGSNSPSLILTGSSGTIQWESAPSNSGPWTSVTGGINATLSSTTIGILSQTTYFRAKVSNPTCGSVYSSIRTIFIVPQAVLGNVSSNDTVCYGSSTILSITGYSGTIQWQKYSNNLWVNIPSATTSQLNTGTLTVSTIYRVIVSSGNCFSASSNSITITVNSLSTVGNIGSSHTICQGSLPSNIILNSYNGAITWQSSPNNSTWTDINGQSSSTLLGSAIGSLNVSTYIRAKVTNFPCASVFSNSILITVIPAGNPGTPSSNQSICSGTQPMPIVSTGTVGTLQWQFASNSNGPWTSIIGATSSTLSSAQMGSLTSTRYYRLAATNGQCTTIYSNNVTISVSQPSVSGTISSNQNICMGSQPLNISLSSFNGAIQWQESSNIFGPFSNIGTGSNLLTGSQVGTITSTKYIRAQVTSTGCPSTTSNILTITALTLPAISAGSDVTICNGDSLVLNGSGGLSYQWSSNVVNGQPFVPQSTTTFTVVGIGSNGCSNSDNVVVTVLSLPNVTLNYSSPSQICQGGLYTITANTSSNVSFQWIRNNLLIAGATNNSIQVNQAGVYKVRVTSNSTGCQKYSNSINLTVLPVPTLNVVGNTNVCSGDTAFLNAVSNGNVIWNGTLTQPSYQLSPTISTPFSVVSTGSNGCVSSYNDTIQVYYPFDTTINISSYGPLSLNGYNYDQSGTYIQNLNSIYGCDSSVTINLYVYTNEINQSVFEEISIVNPVKNNILQINKINDISFYLKSVLDCTGRKVKVQMLSSNQTIEEYFIDVIPGIYYLEYELNGIIITKQLLFSN
jgi:hypothetical protein